MKFLVEIPDSEVLDAFPPRTTKASKMSAAQMALEDIRESLETGSVFAEVKVTHYEDSEGGVA